MQVKKIISGAQTGADRAALDFAIEYNIPCGGWVPAGRQAEDGRIPDHYTIWEMEDGGYVERTEQNVKDSDGTLIFSHGELTGGSLLTREFAEKHGRPWLHIDFNQLLAFDAAIDVNDWIAEYSIEILNIAGARASKDPDIYQEVYKILETVFYVSIISDAMPDVVNRPEEMSGPEGGAGRDYPAGVEEAVDFLLAELTPKNKARIASMSEGRLSDAGLSLGQRVYRKFGLNAGNRTLLEACRAFAGKPSLDADGAAMLIVRELRDRLRQMGHLRIIK